MTAVLGVDLREAEDLGVGERSPEAFAEAFEIGDLGVGEGETLLLVISLEVGYMDNGIGLFVDGEDGLVESLVEVLEHGVERGVLVVDGEELLDTRDAFETHVLRDFYGVGAPRCDCLTSRADEETREELLIDELSAAEEPCEFAGVGLIERMRGLDCQDVLCSEKYYHLDLLGFVADRRNMGAGVDFVGSVGGIVCSYGFA